jgi:hypothetical protein
MAFLPTMKLGVWFFLLVYESWILARHKDIYFRAYRVAYWTFSSNL